VFDAKEQFPNLTFEKTPYTITPETLNGKRVICTQSNYYEFITSDIASAENQILVFSPFMTENRLSTLLPVILDAVNRDVKIYVVTKPIDEHGIKEQSIYSACEKELRSLGVYIIHKKGMHEKLVLIDDSVVWTGSLNTLSFSNTQEIMERRQDRELFRDYSSQMYIDKMLEPAEHPEEQRCPICGAEIIAAESDKGGIYWRCVNNDYSRNVDQKYPHDGELTCKKCNSKLTFSMINEPR
jgi:hypothetical protein